MTLLFLIPFTLGALGVFQTILNRSFGSQYSFREAVWVNGFFVFSSATIYLVYGVLTKSPDIADGPYRVLRDFKYWYCIPGILGFVLVLGFPWAASQIGATRAFVAAVSGQLLASLFFDWYFSGQKPEALKIVGVVLALLGALVANLKSLSKA
jgi:uncharacterized membrane protein YdcZ (DUF606 family)